ncbi:unnamed protein product [Rotaria magnacalcarata]|uniref:Eukaryotic translation initiation factor 5 n=5 Tax=Rotaria magnacalcarata TaxID=392030 RepID=A0A816K690_9BILA|nr:unnamed protein product [Rotaria magnacalcarata]CAF1901759.1 unnamed protein product [Rotaria magnacalcarata]
MPKLAAKVEGTGNGIKTVLVNVTAIAKALNRPPTYVTKFFGCELGAQVQMNAKEDRYIVNGAHDCEKLQNLLDGFIKRFVLCPKCDNPETRLSVRKRNGGEINQVCAACGYSGIIIMASHKLTTYIAKNPPDAEAKGETAPEIKTKDRSKSKKNANSTGGTNRDSDEGSPTESNGKTNGTSKNGGGGGDDDDEDDEDWGDDTTADLAELNHQIKGMIQTDDLDKPLAERCDQYGRLVEKKKTDQKLNDIETVKDLLAEAERLEIMEQAPFIVGQCVFTENILKDIDDYKLLFTKLCTKNAKGQKYLLHAIEALIGEHEEIRKKIFNKKTMSKILLKFYDEDIIEEDTFYTWHEKASKRFTDKNTAKEIREMANDFIKWLRTAEESSDEEDDDDKSPEPQIDFTDTVNKSPVKDYGEIIHAENI